MPSACSPELRSTRLGNPLGGAAIMADDLATNFTAESVALAAQVLATGILQGEISSYGRKLIEQGFFCSNRNHRPSADNPTHE
ncbi:MAG: hypothetical protein Q8P82_00570 [bacterium]|nr:hypothetical protein [bacterium]